MLYKECYILLILLGQRSRSLLSQIQATTLDRSRFFRTNQGKLCGQRHLFKICEPASCNQETISLLERSPASGSAKSPLHHVGLNQAICDLPVQVSSIFTIAIGTQKQSSSTPHVLTTRPQSQDKLRTGYCCSLKPARRSLLLIQLTGSRLKPSGSWVFLAIQRAWQVRSNPPLHPQQIELKKRP